LTEPSQFSLFEATSVVSPTELEAPAPAEPSASAAETPSASAPGAPAPGESPETELIAPGESPETAVPISELNAAAREVLERSIRPLWVVGEVANWRRMDSGQCYFSLRDEAAQVSCVMWRSEARRLPTDPQEGMEVCAYGRVSVYVARGQYQLIVERLEAKGEGLWKLAFERLRRRLEAEGLTDPARRRPLPFLPARVGVVTSREGAALRDLVSVIRRRAPWTHILLSPCRVQGDGAAREIVAALEAVTRGAGVDVVVLTRGGGSVEDLWCFNEEEVARAVAACPVPIVTAVGHEVDVTIVDLVADRRAATPSAAAELVVPDAAELRSRIARKASALVSALRGRARRAEERASRASERMHAGVGRFLERCSSRLEYLAGQLEALGPLATIARGYAVPMDESGRVLRRLGMYAPGDAFRLRVVDGEVAARVEGTARLEGAAGDGEPSRDESDGEPESA